MKSTFLRVRSLVVLGFFLLSAHLVSASNFECSKALNEIENLICTDAELSSLDSTLGKIYKNSKNQNPALVIEQKNG